MADTDFNIGLVAELDGDESKKQINSDIKNIQKQLDKLKLTAEIDGKQLDDVKSQLNRLHVSLNDVTISQSALNQMVKTVNNALSRIQIANINVGSSASSLQNAGRQMAQQVQSGYNSAIQKGTFVHEFGVSANGLNQTSKDAERYFQTLSRTASVVERMNDQNQLYGFVVSLEKAQGVTERLEYEFNALTRTFQYTGGSINDNGIIRQMAAVSTAVDKAKGKLNELTSLDSGISKFSANMNGLPVTVQSLAAELSNVTSKDDVGKWNEKLKAFIKQAESAGYTVKATTDTQAAAYDNAYRELKKLYDLKIEYAKVGSNKDSDYYYQRKIANQENTYRQAYAQTSTPENWDVQKRLDLEQQELLMQQKLEEAYDRVNAKQKEIQLNIDTEKYATQIAQLNSEMQKMQSVSSETMTKYKTSLSELQAAYEAMSNSNGNDRLSAEQNYQVALQKTKNLLTQLRLEYDKSADAADKMARITKAESAQKWINNNTRAMKEFGAEIQECIAKLNDLETPMTKAELAGISQQIKTIQTQARQAGLLGMSLSDKLETAATKFTGWATATGMVMNAYNAIRKMPSIVTELDTSLVDLRKTTTMSADELERFYYRANDIAKQSDATTNEILTQASAWSRLGYSSADAAEKMARYSAMFKLISPGMDLNSATDGLVSVMKAFKIGAEDVDDVVDGIMSKVNIIGNTRALDNSDIIDFLTRSSSAMAEANNTLDETIALGTAATEITRNAASVGEALKTVSMRIRGKQSLPPYTVMYMQCA